MRCIINSTQIDEYFNPKRRDAQELLPHLVKKLVYETINMESLVSCRIPVGDEINRPGFDGRVETAEGNNFVPTGLSVWEMGTGDPESKAEKDYILRSKNPRGIDQKTATFIFVTPHRWDGKEKWVAEKLRDGLWKNIKVLDDLELADWIEMAPATARWLARQIGIPIDSFRDVDLFLNEFCMPYGGIKVPDELVIGGRDDVVAELSNCINCDSKEIVIQGETVEEAAAFIAATIRKLPNEKGQQISTKTLFVNEQSAIDFLASCRSQHFVVPLNNEVYKRAKALQLQHVRLIIPLKKLEGYFTRGGNKLIELGLVHRRPCCEILNNMGIPSHKADRIASESKGSLLALLLLLGGWQDEDLPWITGEAALELIPLMLARQWSVDNQNDHSVIEKLSDKKYNEVEKTIARWKTPKGPLIHRGPIWDWPAWDFAWKHFAPVIDKAQIDRFIKTAKEVLTTPDPRFELPSDKRYAASIYGKVHPYSGALRSGLIGSIVQLALHDSAIMGASGQAIADSLVHHLLISQDDTFPTNTWLSISSWLPDLAEASPIVFLEACEKIVKNIDAIEKIFEEGDEFFSSSEHTHLLWALERLAWSEEYLTRVALILGELSALDPGGKLANRPINSLKEIFLPWHPNTTASVQHRLDALDVLYNKKPDIGWKLACYLLPQGHDISRPTADPKWRDWKAEDTPKTTVGEYWTFVRELITRMIEWAGNSGERWPSLIKAYNTLRRQYPELGGNLLSAITRLEHKAFSEKGRAAMSEKFRKILTQHRKFPDAEWSMDEGELSIFEELYKKFRPADIIKQYSWLFDSWPEVPISRHIDYQQRQEYIQAERLNAIKDIYRPKGLKGLFLLAQNVQSPYDVGFSASQIELKKPDENNLVKHCLSASIGSEKQLCDLQMGQGFVRSRYQKDGIEWAKNIVLQDSIEWDDNKYLNLALGLPANPETWNLMEKLGDNIPQLYWKNVGTHCISPYESSTEYAIIQLFEAGRPYAALNLASFSIRSNAPEKDKIPLSRELIIKLLEEAPKHDPTEEKDVAFNSLSFEISELLDVLEAKGAELSKLAQLEWTWMPALEYSERGLKALQQTLSKEPSLFIDLLKAVYLGKNEEPQDRSEQEKARASQALRLLENWKIVPGLLEGYIEEEGEGDITFPKGQVDREKLFAWVKEARELANKCERLDICDSRIGHMLAYSPYDAEGHWPCEAVCNLIEELASTKLERGVKVGVHNKRGVHAAAKGGEQERELAHKFSQYAHKVCSRWPRTAAMLNHIADSYEWEASQRDEEDAFEEFE